MQDQTFIYYLINLLELRKIILVALNVDKNENLTPQKMANVIFQALASRK